MEISKEYLLLFNAINDAIEILEESIRRDERLLRQLKQAQQKAEELCIDEPEE